MQARCFGISKKRSKINNKFVDISERFKWLKEVYAHCNWLKNDRLRWEWNASTKAIYKYVDEQRIFSDLILLAKFNVLNELDHSRLTMNEHMNFIELLRNSGFPDEAIRSLLNLAIHFNLLFEEFLDIMQLDGLITTKHILKDEIKLRSILQIYVNIKEQIKGYFFRI